MGSLRPGTCATTRRRGIRCSGVRWSRTCCAGCRSAWRVSAHRTTARREKRRERVVLRVDDALRCCGVAGCGSSPVTEACHFLCACRCRRRALRRRSHQARRRQDRLRRGPHRRLRRRGPRRRSRHSRLPPTRRRLSRRLPARRPARLPRSPRPPLTRPARRRRPRARPSWASVTSKSAQESTATMATTAAPPGRLI